VLCYLQPFCDALCMCVFATEEQQQSDADTCKKSIGVMYCTYCHKTKRSPHSQYTRLAANPRPVNAADELDKVSGGHFGDWQTQSSCVSEWSIWFALCMSIVVKVLGGRRSALSAVLHPHQWQP